MKILFIQPPYPFSEFPKPSYALMSMGAVLKEQGMDVEVLDLLSTRYSQKKIEDRLARYQPDLIGITSVTMNFPAAARILQTCKTLMPEATAVIGGPHATFMAEETLRSYPEVDLVVRGEGEETIREVAIALDRREGLEKVQGLTFRRNGTVARTEDRPFIEDIDRLPLPDRTLFPISRYLAMRVPASVLTSRGCPTGCSFCVGYRMTGRKGRFRNPLRVVDEIEAARRLGFEEVCIDDDLFTRNRRHVTAICDEILNRGLTLKLYIFARVDTVDEPLLRKLKEAGCAMICFGLESGNQRILDLANKRATVERARRAVELSKAAGIAPFGSFILGLPGETRETMEETVSFARSLGIPYGFHLLSPFPGTRIRERASEYGIKILTDDWSLYDADHAVTETEALKAGEVESLAKNFFANLTAEIERMKKGTLTGTYTGPYREEMEKRLEVDFAWKLLSRDLLEEEGAIPEAEVPLRDGRPLPLEPLGRRIASAAEMPQEFVEKILRKWVVKELIVCRKDPAFHRWSWRESSTARSPLQKSPPPP
ncbi:MAG: radical SAM protein [Deltaproteobacteria bacterium]|nr:radical SAM protein [Deltaproteobacteria bacterium]